MLLGLEIAPTRAAAVLADSEGVAQFALRQDFAPSSPPATQWLAAMELCRALLHRAARPVQDLQRIGISFPSPVSPQGIAQKDPTHPGWEGYDLKRGIREHLGVSSLPDEAILASSRALAEGWGEAQFGALREQTNWLYLHLGSTLESALSLQGRAYIGASSSSGDIGGLIIERDGSLDALGRRGTLRAYCSGEAFESRARSYGLTFTTASEIWAMAPSNFAAQSLAEDFTSRLAQGLAGAISLLEPAQICFGGAFGTAIFDQLGAPLASKLRDMALPRAVASVRLVKAQLGDDAASLGAVALALRPPF
jgi:glucokinase